MVGAIQGRSSGGDLVQDHRAQGQTMNAGQLRSRVWNFMLHFAGIPRLLSFSMFQHACYVCISWHSIDGPWLEHFGGLHFATLTLHATEFVRGYYVLYDDNVKRHSWNFYNSLH